MNTDKAIRVSTAAVVVGVAGIAAYVSYSHAYALISTHGEDKATAAVMPATVDGLIFASSMVMLDASRRGQDAPGLARWTLVLGIGASITANVAHGLHHGLVGAIVAGWPALALILVYELLMKLIRGSAERGPVAAPDMSPAIPDIASAIPATEPAIVAAAPAIPATDADTRGHVAALLAQDPDISGAEIARQTGLSDRHARRLRGEIRPTVMNGIAVK